MALNKPDREAINKAAASSNSTVTYSDSLGSVYINGTKYTDRHNALNKLRGS